MRGTKQSAVVTNILKFIDSNRGVEPRATPLNGNTAVLDYETTIDIVITCKTHEECLRISQKIKKQCDAWIDLGIVYSERKTAKKGDVFSRCIMISQTDYGHRVIIFREAIACISWLEVQKGKLILNVRETVPVNIPWVVPIL